MTYKRGFVVVVKADGKILREKDDSTVFMPFGSEYSLMLKNLESRRSLVNISIDGTDVTHGGLIIQPNSTVELERFIKDLKQGNRFKFIEKTKQISEHRGDKMDDGLIRVEFAFEKRKPIIHTEIIHEHHHGYWPPYPQYPTAWYNSNIRNISSNLSGGSVCSSLNYSSSGPQGCVGTPGTPGWEGRNESNAPHINLVQTDLSYDGITVPGSISNQEFINVGGFETDPSEVIIINIKGFYNKERVEEPIAVNTKISCVTCGTANSSAHNYCKKCGTALEIC